MGPKGSVQTEKGVMVAQRHIHMLPADAERFGVHDGQVVDLEAEGPRGGILRNTAIRVTAQSQLECIWIWRRQMLSVWEELPWYISIAKLYWKSSAENGWTVIM
mgnify:CR=1 FL=1